VGPRAVLDAVVQRKILSPRRESNPRTPIVQPVLIPKSECLSPGDLSMDEISLRDLEAMHTELYFCFILISKPLKKTGSKDPIISDLGSKFQSVREFSSLCKVSHFLLHVLGLVWFFRVEPQTWLYKLISVNLVKFIYC
jgi:hypothetical protein